MKEPCLGNVLHNENGALGHSADQHHREAMKSIS